MPDTAASMRSLLESVRGRAEEADVFGEVSVTEGRLTAPARDAASPAEYRLAALDDGLWVSLVTADRWLSGSIEADLMNSSDSLSELLEEELADLGFDGDGPAYEHYRSDDMLFTFRSRVPVDANDPTSPKSIDNACFFLLGYEITFRSLGDMTAEDED